MATLLGGINEDVPTTQEKTKIRTAAEFEFQTRTSIKIHVFVFHELFKERSSSYPDIKNVDFNNYIL